MKEATTKNTKCTKNHKKLFDAFKYDWALSLALERETTLAELIRETFLIGGLEKAGTKRSMNSEGGPDNRMSKSSLFSVPVPSVHRANLRGKSTGGPPSFRSNNQKKPPFFVALRVLRVLRGRFLLGWRHSLLLLRQISHCPEPRDTFTERRMSCHEVCHFSFALSPH